MKSPIEVVEEWIQHFNHADLNALTELYDENAINHQVVMQPLIGISAIREMFEIEFSRAKMVCIKEAIYPSGDWAILEWRDPNGLRGCGFFKIQNEKIVFQRGYFDQLTFFRKQGLEIPSDYLNQGNSTQ
ncbi:MAG: nuclear transport factor 2 family protein [Chloroherpetonaceae bacterium]|nr:nuclear transport factor 2 family protein [Chloroherpetonaceae bacterium]